MKPILAEKSVGFRFPVASLILLWVNHGWILNYSLIRILIRLCVRLGLCGEHPVWLWHQKKKEGEFRLSFWHLWWWYKNICFTFTCLCDVGKLIMQWTPSVLSCSVQLEWTSYIYMKGCIAALEDLLPGNLYTLAIIFVVISVLQVLATPRLTIQILEPDQPLHTWTDGVRLQKWKWKHPENIFSDWWRN